VFDGTDYNPRRKRLAIQIELPQEEWIKILDMLADYPFRRVAPLIQTLQQQLMPQMQQPMPQMPQRNNGEARTPPPGGNN
jgi:hypothetical protein